MTSRQKRLEFEAFVRRQARQPREETPGRRPGRRFRRAIADGLGVMFAKDLAAKDPTGEGLAWLRRKAAGR